MCDVALEQNRAPNDGEHPEGDPTQVRRDSLQTLTADTHSIPFKRCDNSSVQIAIEKDSLERSQTSSKISFSKAAQPTGTNYVVCATSLSEENFLSNTDEVKREAKSGSMSGTRDIIELLEDDDSQQFSSKPIIPIQPTRTSNESAAYTPGLIQLMNTALRAESARYRLCSPCYHVTQTGFEGAKWACGFRNLQMLMLSLIQRPEFKAALFSGSGDIPDVYGLQSWIEKAWADGFDPVVIQQHDVIALPLPYHCYVSIVT